MKPFIKSLFITLALLPAVALAGSKSTGADQYEFKAQPVMNTRIDLTIEIVPTIGQLRNIAIRKYHVMPEIANQMLGFSAWSPQNNKCTIYILNPAQIYMPEQMGHELMHCAYGNWHSDFLPARPSVRYQRLIKTGEL